MSDSVWPHRWQPTRLCHPWDSPGKNTGVGCHFLPQYMKVKSESEVTQSCLTLHNPRDCSRPGSSVHGIFQARVLEWVAIAPSSLSFSHHHYGLLFPILSLYKSKNISLKSSFFKCTNVSRNWRKCLPFLILIELPYTYSVPPVIYICWWRRYN